MEIWPDAVVYSPGKYVVEIGMGDGGCTNATHGATVFFDAEGIDETSFPIVKKQGAATNRKDEGGRTVYISFEVMA